MSKLKPGELRIEIEEEEPLWYDRKRVPALFGAPWTFTRFTLTPTKILKERGLLNRAEEEVKLYRVTDIAYTQTLLERLCKLGSLTILSDDTSCPELKVLHIKNAKKVKEAISQQVDEVRKNKGVRASEFIG